MSTASKSPYVLELRNVSKRFAGASGGEKEALRGVSLGVAPGECVGLVGESGSGKSTLANIALRLTVPTSGSVIFCGEDITRLKGRHLRGVYQSMQAVFQNPADSFNPRRCLGSSMAEGLLNAGVGKAQARAQVAQLMERCGLDPSIAQRYPGQVSGGQLQRAALVRALSVGPELLVCDEATSALDATTQKQVVQLIRSLAKERNMAVLFICHDIALVAQLCSRVAVLHDGIVEEEGSVDQVIHHPQSSYTKLLTGSAMGV